MMHHLADEVKDRLITQGLGNIQIIIPALNEEAAIRRVLESIPKQYRNDIIVVDNGSTDNTVQLASECGVTVLLESRRGYGSACLRGIDEALRRSASVVVFIDADSSDNPADIERILDEMLRRNLDLVIGTRTTGLAESGALPAHARLGNIFATWLLHMRYGFRFTDLGPLRAIRVQELKRLNMQDLTFGWTVEMQAKALQYRLKVGEIPLHYRNRIGKSKISGTIRGSVCAGCKIIWIVFKHCLLNPFQTDSRTRILDS